MYQKIYSYGISGLTVYPLTIEIDVQPGLPAFHIVGLPDNAIRESKERVRSAIRNTDYKWLPRRITVNLSPAHIKKEGPSFDLAICLGLLAATGQIDIPDLTRFIFLGEVSLDGQLQPVRGALPIALSSRAHDFAGLFVPSSSAAEAALNKNTPVYGVDSLAETISFLTDPSQRQTHTGSINKNTLSVTSKYDYQDVKGQQHVKRGLEIAAAGGHNVLLIGPPGSGKSMMAKRFPSILPDLNDHEIMDVTKIHSIMGLLKNHTALMRHRPFRAPHHTTSATAIVGGGTIPKPGEVTLAHHGVLFLDELPEFNRHVLESLRQPLEDRHVTIARTQQTVTFPAKFILVAAMNPCPCGFFTDKRRPCRCTSHQIQKYLGKVSGPLLDRLDIHLEVPSMKTEDMIKTASSEPSLKIKERTVHAWKKSQDRFKETALMNNARMSRKDIQVFCPLPPAAGQLLQDAMNHLRLSARAYDKIIRIARTIADLDDSDDIQEHHIAEAISYRSLDRGYWR